MTRPIILAENADQIRIETYGRAVADGVEANPTDFPNPIPTPDDVRSAIKIYVDSIKPIREQSIATNEITEGFRKTAVNLTNQLIGFAAYKVNFDEVKLKNANIEIPSPKKKRSISKLEIKSSRMGTEVGTYFFRLVDKAGASTIGVFRKDADEKFRLVDAFDVAIFTLRNQPSGSQTYIFKGKKGNNDWDENSTSNAITVNVP